MTAILKDQRKNLSGDDDDFDAEDAILKTLLPPEDKDAKRPSKKKTVETKTRATPPKDEDDEPSAEKPEDDDDDARMRKRPKTKMRRRRGSGSHHRGQSRRARPNRSGQPACPSVWSRKLSHQEVYGSRRAEKAVRDPAH